MVEGKRCLRLARSLVSDLTCKLECGVFVLAARAWCRGRWPGWFPPWSAAAGACPLLAVARLAGSVGVNLRTALLLLMYTHALTAYSCGSLWFDPTLVYSQEDDFFLNRLS